MSEMIKHGGVGEGMEQGLNGGRRLAWGLEGKRGDQINHHPTDNWTSLTQGSVAAP